MGAPEVEVFVLNKTETVQPLRSLATGEGGIMIDRWAFSRNASARLKISATRATGDPTVDGTSEPSGG
jgi:hypothetical protein